MKLSHEVFMTCVMRLAPSQESLFATKKKTASCMSCAQRQMARLEMSDKLQYSYFSQRVFCNENLVRFPEDAISFFV